MPDTWASPGDCWMVPKPIEFADGEPCLGGLLGPIRAMASVI
jgi:hypothetical protein